MTVINLTPHEINIHVELGSAHLSRTLTLAPSGIVPRARTTQRTIGHVLVEGVEVPVAQTAYGEVYDMPEPQPDTWLVVSLIVAQACPGRADLLIPGEAIRDGAGRIVGCRGLARVGGAS
jgi:hypothetical protein